jgi:NAD(P)-dependent dehydrogenase (short-subunit alcohol dehydrogenase family)
MRADCSLCLKRPPNRLRSAFRQYAAQGSGGAIVITGSICSLRGSDDLVPYHASKHAVLGLMRSAAVHGGERGIRVNGVAPGVVLTDLVAGSPEGAADATRRALARNGGGTLTKLPT